MRRGRTYDSVWFLGSIVLILVGIIGFIALSPLFERDVPQVKAPATIVWNLKSPLTLSITDNESLKEYKVAVIDGTKMTELVNVQLDVPTKVADLNLTYPKNAFVPSKSAYLSVYAKDKSLWSWLGGNRIDVKIPIVIDTVSPQVKILANSHAIFKGGSALVVFEAKDDMKLTSAWLQTNSGRKFKVQPFDKNNTYAAIIAWDVKEPVFNIYATASDLAGNISRVEVPIFKRDIAYKVSKLEITPEFVGQKMAHLCANTPFAKDAVACFEYVNNTLRYQNEELIVKLTDRIGTSSVNGFFTEPFLPITKAQVVGSFGDHRFFYYNNQEISQSYHLGIDFASTKEAAIYAPNNGVVLFTGDNGILGKMLAIYHGLGVSTIYGHCSSFDVKEGDLVMRGKQVARTGATGLAFGDHLHYGVIVQGIAVRPTEWLDQKWIRDNITSVFQKAKEGL